MSCEAGTIATVKNTGHRMPPQRLIILSAIRQANVHVTVSQIEINVRESYPTIDVSTVYRNLTTLRDLRLVSETRIDSGESQYEWIDQDRHHHIVCRNCSDIVQIDDTFLESLAQSLMKDYDFTQDTDHITIHGICAACLK